LAEGRSAVLGLNAQPSGLHNATSLGQPGMSRIAQINLRVRLSLKAKLEKLAKQDRRTLSAYIEKQLEDHVAEQERRRISVVR
jgi:hypothetical protein